MDGRISHPAFGLRYKILPEHHKVRHEIPQNSYKEFLAELQPHSEMQQ